MSRWLHHLWLTHFSKPKGQRVLFRTLKERPARSILEIGVGDLSRAERLIDFAGEFLPNGELHYTAIDLFEGRPDPATGISLKEAHGRLKQLDAKIKVVPGDPFSALARAANSLGQTDLVLIASDIDAESMQRAWTYLPRTLHQHSRILIGRPGNAGDEYVAMTTAEIAAAAGANVKHITRAA